MKERANWRTVVLLPFMAIAVYPAVGVDVKSAVPFIQESQELDKGTKDITKPEILTKVNPVYPEDAKKEGVMGDIKLDAVVDETGKVQDVVKQADQVVDERLVKAAMEALKQWKFKPAMNKQGKPVSVKTTITIRFKLK